MAGVWAASAVHAARSWRVAAQAPIHSVWRAPAPVFRVWAGCGLQSRCMRCGAGRAVPGRGAYAAGCSRDACGAGRAGWCQAGVHVPRAAQHRPTASSIGRGHGEVQGEGRPPSSSAAMMYCAACTTRCTGLRPHERRKRLLSTRICAAPHAKTLSYSALSIGHHNEIRAHGLARYKRASALLDMPSVYHSCCKAHVFLCAAGCAEETWAMRAW